MILITKIIHHPLEYFHFTFTNVTLLLSVPGPENKIVNLNLIWKNITSF